MGVPPTVATSFNYSYETGREEFVEGCIATLGEEIAKQSRWRPSVQLLIAAGIAGAVTSMLADTTYGRIVCVLVPLAIGVLLTISSKQTRIESVTQEITIALSKHYDEDKCHLTDIHLDDNGFSTTCPCGTATRNWKAIKRWHDTEHLIVLEAFNGANYMIPKRVVPDPELRPFRDLISSHVKAA